MHDLVDIICLVHNKLPVTKGFVEHLFENTDNFRLIFVDNGSTDDTAQYLAEGKSAKRWDVISPGCNLGIINGRNLGAKHVKAPYFLNIDNDQYVGPEWLDKLFDVMKNKKYDVVGVEAWCLYPPGTGGVVTVNETKHGRSYYPFRKCTNPSDRFTYIGCGGMLIKKSVYDKIGLFDERFNPAYYEDPDYCFRLIQAGFKLGWCQNCSIKHLSHQTMDSQKLFHKNAQFIKSWKAFIAKWHPYFPNPLQS
jgi:GT2 family glycosyltransferase